MMQPDPELINKVINPMLHEYLAEIKIVLYNIKQIKSEFRKWWNCETNQPSDTSRNCRAEYEIRDDIVRNSFRYNLIIQLYSILKDNQSKGFDKIYKKFRKTSHQKIIESIFKPPWNEFEEHHEEEIERLKNNRNKYFGHLSKDQPVNEVLEQGNVVGIKIIRTSDSNSWLIEYEDICDKMHLFSDSSLDYLINLIQLINFSNIPDDGVFESITNNINKHVVEFRTNNDLNK